MNKSWYCTHTYIAEWWPITMLRVIWNPLALCIVSLFCFGNSEALLWQVNVLSFDIDMEERKEKRELISGQQKRFFSSILSEFPVLRCLISRGFLHSNTGREQSEEAGEGPTVLQIWKNIAKRNWWISAREGQWEHFYSNCIFNAQKPNEVTVESRKQVDLYYKSNLNITLGKLQKTYYAI